LTNSLANQKADIEPENKNVERKTEEEISDGRPYSHINESKVHAVTVTRIFLPDFQCD